MLVIQQQIAHVSPINFGLSEHLPLMLN